MKIIKTEEKRVIIIYTTVLIWIIFGILASLFNIPYPSLSVYFLSLTGFVSAYIWGESVRKSETSTIFHKGATSSREKMMYAVVILWILLGLWGIYKSNDFVDLAAYFGSLTPFVGAYILGKTYKPNEISTEKPKVIQSVNKPADEVG